MRPTRAGILAGVGVVAAAGLGAGVALAATGSPGGSTAGSPASSPGYSYYRSIMSRYAGPGGMMNGLPGHSMMAAAGYRWMMGGPQAPGWMRGGALPGAMMGTATDPGKVMGRLWASAPGPRVSPASAARAASQVPAGAQVDRAARTITFTATTVRLTVVASPAGGPDETFRIAGLVNPTLVVPAGSAVTMRLINADPGTAHGVVVTAGPLASWMPMMTSAPAFRGSAAWFLGGPTSAGLHTATMTFTATTPGTYHYLCPVPGHARRGMAGTFTVKTAS